MQATDDETGMSPGPSHPFFVLILFDVLGPCRQLAARRAASASRTRTLKLDRRPSNPPPPHPRLSLSSRSPLPNTPLSPPPASATPPAPPTKTITGAVVEDGEGEQHSGNDDGSLGPGVAGPGGGWVWDPLPPPLLGLPFEGDRSEDHPLVGMGPRATDVDSRGCEKSETGGT